MILHNTIRHITVYDTVLVSSLLLNVFCVSHIQQQNAKIKELIDINNSLIDSVSKLNVEISKIREEVALIHSKSTPIHINPVEGLLNEPFLTFCLGLAFLGGATYYFGPTVVAKVSSLKLIKEINVFFKDLSATLHIKMCNDKVVDLKFRHVDDESFTHLSKSAVCSAVFPAFLSLAV